MGLYIAVSHLSFYTEESLEIIKQIPIDKLLVATNSPFSSMAPNN